MLAQKKRTRLYLILIAVIVVVIIALIAWHAGSKQDTSLPEVTPRPTPEIIIKEKQVEKTITAEILEDGIRDMGVLVTQEYSFTEVVSFSRIKKLFSISLPFTESSYLASYEGIVTAGIDLSEVKVERDITEGTITVYLPAAAIQNIDIDPNSFELYDEKSGIGNPISVEDFNTSLIELERNAKDKAISRGILIRADENARTVISNFIRSMIDPASFTLKFDHLENSGR